MRKQLTLTAAALAVAVFLSSCSYTSISKQNDDIQNGSSNAGISDSQDTLNSGISTGSDAGSNHSVVSLAGTDYKIEKDGSYMVFGSENESGGFRWYQDQNNLSDNYYIGSYQVYTGDAAVDFVTQDLSCYGVTKDELERVLLIKDRNEFIVLFVEYSDLIVDVRSKIDSFSNSIDKAHPKSIAYYGQIEDNGNMSLVNMINANPVNLKRMS